MIKVFISYYFGDIPIINNRFYLDDEKVFCDLTDTEYATLLVLDLIEFFDAGTQPAYKISYEEIKYVYMLRKQHKKSEHEYIYDKFSEIFGW